LFDDKAHRNGVNRISSVKPRTQSQWRTKTSASKTWKMC